MAGFSQKSKSKFSQLIKTWSESFNHGTIANADKFTTVVRSRSGLLAASAICALFESTQMIHPRMISYVDILDATYIHNSNHMRPLVSSLSFQGWLQRVL
jgi:hypothetical protein